jgi:hypothetical protein
MALRSNQYRLGVFLVAAGCIFASSTPAISDRVGVTAAVNPTATGHPPGLSERQLKIGTDIVRNERIRTTSQGSTQVIFIDRTTLTVSANSDITINEYVFNRGANSGNMAITVGRGLMRFVGGQISHSGSVRISTPTATMGIRGGMALVNSANGKTTVIHLHGATTVRAGGNTVTITRPGHYTEASGGHVSAPSPAPPGLLASYNAQLQSKPGQTAGSKPGHVTSDRLNGSSRDSARGNSNSRTRESTDPNVSSGSLAGQTSSTASAGGTGGLGGGGIGGGGIGGGGGGGGIGGGGGGGPAWGLGIAPGQTGNFPGPPPGAGIKGPKH